MESTSPAKVAAGPEKSVVKIVATSAQFSGLGVEGAEPGTVASRILAQKGWSGALVCTTALLSAGLIFTTALASVPRSKNSPCVGGMLLLARATHLAYWSWSHLAQEVVDRGEPPFGLLSLQALVLDDVDLAWRQHASNLEEQLDEDVLGPNGRSLLR
jgi:hypothetical protein